MHYYSRRSPKQLTQTAARNQVVPTRLRLAASHVTLLALQLHAVSSAVLLAFTGAATETGTEIAKRQALTLATCMLATWRHMSQSPCWRACSAAAER